MLIATGFSKGNKFDFLLITSCKNDINTDNFDKWHFSNKNIHNKPFDKSQEFEININEPMALFLLNNNKYLVLYLRLR